MIKMFIKPYNPKHVFHMYPYLYLCLPDECLHVHLNKNVNRAASCMRENGERAAGSGVPFKMPPLDESFLNSEIRDSRRRWTKRP